MKVLDWFLCLVRAKPPAVTVVNHFHLNGSADPRTQRQIAEAVSKSIRHASGRNA